MDADTAKEFAKIWRTLERLRFPETGPRIVVANVDNPPTAAQCVTNFGAAANFYDVGLLIDSVDNIYWLILSDLTSWYAEALTKLI